MGRKRRYHTSRSHNRRGGSSGRGCCRNQGCSPGNICVGNPGRLLRELSTKLSPTMLRLVRFKLTCYLTRTRIASTSCRKIMKKVESIQAIECMRIVQLVNNLDMGGLERLAVDLAYC